MSDPQPARLIPVAGIRDSAEAEVRATSALLAVLTVVRDLSDHLLSPVGASSAKKAVVEAFCEVQYDSADGKRIRPDGLIRVSFGKKKPWQALVEVKTHDNTLDADQINAYWDIARANDLDAVITISNEIAPAPGVHPTEGLKVRSNSPVKVHHFSWTALLSASVMVKQHKGVGGTPITGAHRGATNEQGGEVAAVGRLRRRSARAGGADVAMVECPSGRGDHLRSAAPVRSAPQWAAPTELLNPNPNTNGNGSQQGVDPCVRARRPPPPVLGSGRSGNGDRREGSAGPVTRRRPQHVSTTRPERAR